MTAATTSEGIGLEKLSQLISECPEWMVATGTTAPAGALDYIYAPEKRNETEAQQEDQSPNVFAVIRFPDGAIETQLVAGGGSNQFTLRGKLELILVRQMNSDNIREETILALNLFGAVHRHLLEYAAVDDYLAITNAPMDGFYQSKDEEVAGFAVQKPIHKAVYTIEWGPGI